MPITLGTVLGGLGLVKGLFGGGGQQQATGGYYGQPTSRLSDYLRQQAYMRGLQETFGEQSQETFDPWAAIASASRPTTGTRWQANQAGGQGYPAMLGLGGGEGRGGGDGRGAGGRRTWWEQQQREPEEPENKLGQLYGGYITQALSGMGGLPQNVYQNAIARGMGGINAQALASQQNLMGQMGSRGLLSSGLYGQGLGDLERARLGAASGLFGGLEQQNLAAARQSQSQAAQLFAGSQEAALDRALQLQMQGKAISAAKPSFYDIVGNIAGGYMQYQSAQDYNKLLSGLLAQ